MLRLLCRQAAWFRFLGFEINPFLRHQNRNPVLDTISNINFCALENVALRIVGQPAKREYDTGYVQGVIILMWTSGGKHNPNESTD